MRSRSRVMIIQQLIREGVKEAESYFAFRLDGEIWFPTSTEDDHYERIPHVSGSKTIVSPPKTNGKTGCSGRFYVRNPFGKDNYEIASFESEQAYMDFHPPVYISVDEMMQDLETTEYYEFRISVNGNEETHNVHLDGEMIGKGGNMSDYIDTLYSEHGRDNVRCNYKKCITTSLGSLA